MRNLPQIFAQQLQSQKLIPNQHEHLSPTPNLAPYCNDTLFTTELLISVVDKWKMTRFVMH